MIYIILLCIAVMLIHYCYIHYSARGRLFNKIPGHGPSLPVIGNVLHYLRHIDQIFDVLHSYMPKRYFPILRIWKMFGDVVVALYHPDDIKLLLTSKVELNKANLAYEVFRDYDIDGLLVSNGAKWKSRRKIIETSMKNAVLKNLAMKRSIDIVNTEAKCLLNNINLQGDVTVQDIFSIMMIYTFQSTTNSLLGFSNWNNSDLKVDETLHAFATISNYAVERVALLFIPTWLLQLFPRGKEVKRASKMIEKFIAKIIHERTEYYKNKQINGGKNNDDQGYLKILSDVDSDQLIFMTDVLLQFEAQGSIDRRGVIEEIFFIIIGGYETSGATLAFCLILLAENKWAQDLAREEVLKTLDGSKDEITYDMVQKMPFLERCLKETLRLFPPAPFILRRLSERNVMSNYLIPADTDVAVDIYSVHRNPKFWPDPEKFEPDRFLPERIKSQHAYSFIPFSSGLRSCPGQKYGYVSLKIAMSHFLRNYHLEPVTRSRDLDFGLTMVLHPMSPAYVKFIKIKDN